LADIDGTWTTTRGCTINTNTDTYTDTDTNTSASSSSEASSDANITSAIDNSQQSTTDMIANTDASPTEFSQQEVKNNENKVEKNVRSGAGVVECVPTAMPSRSPEWVPTAAE